MTMQQQESERGEVGELGEANGHLTAADPDTLTMPVPGWEQPRPTIRPQDPPDERATTEAGDGAGESASAAWTADRSSQGSTDQRAKLLADIADRVQLATSAIGMTLAAAGGLANDAFALGDDDPTWLMTQDDHDMIAAPLGRVAARHMPIPDVGGERAADVGDLIMAGIGILAYSVSNMTRRLARKRALRRHGIGMPTSAADEPGRAAGTSEESRTDSGGDSALPLDLLRLPGGIG